MGGRDPRRAFPRRQRKRDARPRSEPKSIAGPERIPKPESFARSKYLAKPKPISRSEFLAKSEPFARPELKSFTKPAAKLRPDRHCQHVDRRRRRFVQPILAHHQCNHASDLDQYWQQSGAGTRRRSRNPR
jgi:hypothetical protein